MKILAYIAAAISLGAVGTWVAFLNADNDIEVVEEPRLPVAVERLQPVRQFTRSRTFSGTIQARRRTPLAFERSARLREMLVDEGDRVECGQPLAELDDRQLHIRIRQTKAELRRQQAVLDELNSGARDEVIAAAEANVKSLAADVNLREKTWERARRLFEKDSISAQMRDEASDSFSAAVARRNAAEAQLAELKNGIRPEKIDAQKAAVESLQHQLSSLQTDLEDSQLTAPFSGTVVSRMVDEGTMLSPQQPVLELLETDHLEAHIGVPVELLSELRDRLAEQAERTEDYQLILRTRTDEVRGRLRTILPQIDPTTRTQTVIIALPQSAVGRIVDGQLVKLDFDENVAVAEHYYKVPNEALVAGANGLWAIYVFEPEFSAGTQTAADTSGPAPRDERSGYGRIRRRDVERLSNTGDAVIVRAMSGAFGGEERIVVAGTHKVVPGQAVLDRSLMSIEN